MFPAGRLPLRKAEAVDRMIPTKTRAGAHMKQPSLIALAIAAAVAAPLAFAQDQSATQQAETEATMTQEMQLPQVPETTAPATFATLDADQDGRVSKDEAAADASLSAAFDDADTDGDGFVSEAEFRVHAAPEMPQQDVPDVQPATL